MDDPRIPTLAEWAGGLPALTRLTELFYRKVATDPLLAPVFAHMDERHPLHVAQFLLEVLGGEALYTANRGGHPHMLQRHLARHLTEAQRRQWMTLMLDTLDEAGLPSDPEFRSAFVAYLEWGTRLAVINSADGVEPEIEAPMPKWGWGVPEGPAKPPKK